MPTRRGLFLLLFSLLWPQVSQAARPGGAADLVGRWENLNKRTRSIPLLEIREQRGRYFLHPWGACQPKFCDWGEVPAQEFTSSVSRKKENQVVALTATHNSGFSKVLMTVRLRASRILEVDLFTSYHDSSDRRPFHVSMRMRRQRQDRDQKKVPALIRNEEIKVQRKKAKKGDLEQALRKMRKQERHLRRELQTENRDAPKTPESVSPKEKSWFGP